MWFVDKFRRCFTYGLLMAVGFCLAVAIAPATSSLVGILRPARAAAPVEQVIAQSTQTAEISQQARERFESADFVAAARLWQAAAEQYEAQGDWLGQARSLSNLSLAQQQQSEWTAAKESIGQSLAILNRHDSDDEALLVQAQALNSQGNLWLSVGRVGDAIASWQEASVTYQAAGDLAGYWQSQMNLAQALQADGFYRKSLDVLSEVADAITAEPESDSRLQASVLRRLGDVQRAAGDLTASAENLEKSLTIARQMSEQGETRAALLGLGNTKRAQGEQDMALNYYQRAIALKSEQTNKRQKDLPAQLAMLNLLTEMPDKAQAVQTLWPEIQQGFKQTLMNRRSIYHRINWVQSLSRMKRGESVLPVGGLSLPGWDELSQVLAVAVSQAQQLEDEKAESYALGYLGGIYEQTQQWAEAQTLTKQALLLAEKADARDIAYRWQWQNARLLKKKGDKGGAIASYADAVKTLETLRNDLVAIHADVQFSFKKDVEPVYREMVDLLLQPNEQPSQQDLSLARETIEALHLAELDDYFKEACTEVTTPSVQLDKVDPEAAILYPIILPERLEMIVSFPGGRLQRYSVPVAEDVLTQATQRLRQTLVIRSRSTYLSSAKRVYDWLIRPVDEDLRASGVKTLTMVPDGPLKNVPMAVLHDGDRYLIEDYRLALTPGLTLSDPQPLPSPSFSILAAGLTQGRSGFSPLSNVKQEIGNIADFSDQNVVLIDESFTQENLQDNVQAQQAPVVHIATHGQFGSSPENTFLVAWDELINVSELDNILRARLLNQDSAIELLVLSACQTAAGDERAALGLAGMAVKSGARSTLATLWSVNDEATTYFMTKFYESLSVPGTTRAEALRETQLSFISEVGYDHPFFWAPFVLLGSWL